MQKDELKATGIRCFYLRYFRGLVIFFLAITTSVSQAQPLDDHHKAIIAATGFARAQAERAFTRLPEAGREKTECAFRRCFKPEPALKTSLKSRIRQVSRPQNDANR